MQKAPRKIYVYHIPNPTASKRLEEGYIGVSLDPKGRFRGHREGPYIVGKAITKYELTEKDVVILAEFEDRDLAHAYERSLRPKENMGWNIAPGGQSGCGATWTPEKREEQCKRFSGENNPFYGKKHNDKNRKKISDGLMKKSEEWRAKVARRAGRANLGVKKSTTENMKVAANLRPKYECPHCGKVGQYNSMIAWHGDSCKKKV
jgi:predicted GIY-YIG superfamily endonuclease